MTLYCANCRKNHNFKPVDILEICYALQGMFIDSQAKGPTIHGDPVLEPGPCWLEVLKAANDIEGYYEHVYNQVEARYQQSFQGNLISSNARGNWWTPDWLFRDLDAKYGPFDIDAAADASNTKCKRWFDQAADGLSQPWEGRIFCNPPYDGKLGRWVVKAINETTYGKCELACLVLPSDTSVAWFHNYVQPFAEIHFVRGRVKFGGAKSTSHKGTLIAVFRSEPNRIAAALQIPIDGFAP